MNLPGTPMNLISLVVLMSAYRDIACEGRVKKEGRLVECYEWMGCVVRGWVVRGCVDRMCCQRGLVVDRI